MERKKKEEMIALEDTIYYELEKKAMTFNQILRTFFPKEHQAISKKRNLIQRAITSLIREGKIKFKRTEEQTLYSCA